MGRALNDESEIALGGSRRLRREEIVSVLSEVEQRTVETYEAQASAWVGARRSGAEFWLAELQKLEERVASGRILDLGSGGGRDAELLSDHGFSVYGVDISESLLEIAREREPRASFSYGSVYQIPFGDEFFDAAWVCAVLLHVPQQRIQEALAEIHRVLKHGAGLFVAVKQGDGEEVEAATIGERFFSYWQPQEISAEIEAAGFSSVDHHLREHSGTTWICLYATRA